MAPIAFTALERFLLCRAIFPKGGDNDQPSFEDAAASLKEDAVLRESGFKDSSKLHAEPLKDLYMSLIKEQVEIARTSRDESPTNDSNSRKRKAVSPSLETVADATTYSYLLPNLLDRLYIQHREETIKSIDEEERQYQVLQKQIQALELHTNEARAARPGSQGVPPISALLRETEESAQPPRAIDQNVNGAADAVHPPPGNLHADIYKPLAQPEGNENGPPYLPPPPAPPAQAYSLPTPGIDRRSSGQAARPSASPRSNQAPLPPPERSSASPIILPPPKGMVRSSGSPPVPSPQQNHYPPPRQPTTQHPAPRPQPYYYDNQGGYPAPYPAYGQPPGPLYHPHGGHMQPYMPSVHPSHASHYPPQTYQSPASSHRSGYYNAHSQYPPATPHTPYTQTSSHYHDRPTPVPRTTSQQSSKPSPLVTSVSSTKWKKFDLPAGTPPPRSPIPPPSRDISPISAAGEVDTELDETPGRDASRRSHSPATGHRSKRNQEITASEQGKTRGRGGRRRGARRGGRGRAGSVASSTPVRSQRSQSIPDDASALNARHTLAADESASDRSMSPNETSPKYPRRRREKLRSVEADPSRLKRKRDDKPSESLPMHRSSLQEDASTFPVAEPRRAPVRPGHVLATRNFSRVTASLINRITAHRLGSLFSKPLSEKDAPGYKDLILRPQDLKTLKAAISSGGRALATALESAGESANSGAQHLWVPASEELRPPKGIVNAWQLDRELARIFANAVMYNPDISENRGLGRMFWEKWKNVKENMGLDGQSQGDDKFEIGVAAPIDGDLVRDTREVAKDAQGYFTEWREVETDDDGEFPIIGGAESIDVEMESIEDKEAKDEMETDEGGERRSKRRKR